jgi:hypothetical protein
MYYQSKYGRNHPETRIAWGRVVVGQAAWIAANKYIDDGLMTADMDPFMTDDKSKKLRYMSDMAYPHGTLNVTAIRDGRNKGREGDTMMNLRDLGPPGRILLANAALRMKMEKMTPEARKKIEDSWMGWQKLAMGQGTLMRQTFAQSFNHGFAQGAVEFTMGVREMASSALSGEGMRKSGLNRAIRPLANAIPNLVPFMPNTMEWFYKLNSPYKQNFRPEDGFVRAVAVKITKRLSVTPWVDAPDDPPYVNMWGEKVQQLPRGTKQFSTGERLLRMTFGRALGDPRKIGGKYEKGQWIRDPASSEVYRLWRKFRKGDEVPSTPSMYLAIEGKSYELTKQQYHDYSVAVGQTRLNGTDDTGDGVWIRSQSGAYKPKTPIVGVYGLVSGDYWEPLGRELGGAKLQVKALQNAYSQGRVYGKKIFLSELRKMNKANGKPPLFGLKEIKDPSGAIRDVLE